MSSTKPIKIERIAVLGGGTWGSTLATILAQQGHDVFIWEFLPDVAKTLRETRSLKTLPQMKLPESIQVSSHISDALKGRDIILSVTPSHTVRATFSSKEAQKSLQRRALVISASKGIEPTSQCRMSEIITEVFPDVGDIVILSGPSHAEEVAEGQPVALVSASTSGVAAQRVCELFRSDTFRVYTSPDPVGVELGGALKNVYALACGITDGLSMGDNIKAALISRGLIEMTRLGTQLGAAAITFFGLSGLGDLIVTCNSKHSRNRSLGEKIGRGQTLDEALKEMTMVAEGVKTMQSAFKLAQSKNIDVPIINEMHQVLFENKTPRDSIRDLMARAAGAEMEGITL